MAFQEVYTLSMLERSVLDKIVSLIVSIAKPRKVILFGSQARQDATEASDIDLMILVDDQATSTRNIVQAVYMEIHALAQMPCDVLVEREGDFMARGALPTMERRILREGIVLYAA
jgi:predicted nucleotidyltransferase